MTKYRLKTDVLWYEKGTTFWFDENHVLGKMLFVQHTSGDPVATIDALFNQIAIYGIEEAEEPSEYFEKVQEVK